MRINKIQINRFGKLEDYSLDFDDGCNIIYGNNEDGKSTIMAFIKMMFYGSTGRNADLTKNIRKKYMPWGGAKMSGSIEFEDKAITYRIERMFGASNSTDKISLWNKATGEKEGIASGTDLGQRFFGIGAAAFEKSVFIGQAGSMSDFGADKEDEITQKLLNLVSTGDETVSQKKVENRLQTAMDELKSKGGKIGVLDKQNQELSRLTEARLVALEEEDKKKQLEQQRAVLAEQKIALEKTHQDNQSQCDLQEELERLQVLEKRIAKKQAIDKSIAECEDSKQQLIVGDTVFDTAFVKNGESQISQIQSLEEVCSERGRNVHALELEDADLKAQAILRIPQNYVEQIKAKEKERFQVKTSIIALKELIQKLTERLKKQAAFAESEQQLRVQTEERRRQENALINAQAELDSARQSLLQRKQDLENKNQELKLTQQQEEKTNTEYQIAMHNIKSVEQLSNQKIETANEQLKQASTPKQVVTNENAGRSLNKPMMAGAAIILILSIALGALVNPLLYVLVVVAVIVGGVSVGKPKMKSVTTTLVDEAEVARAKENLSSVQRAATQDGEAALEAAKGLQNQYQELKSKADLLQSAADEWEQLYQTAAERVARAQQKHNELEMNVKCTSEKLAGLAQDVKAKQDELAEMGDPIEQDDINNLQERLSIKTTQETSLTNDIHTQLAEMECATIDELQNKNMQMQNYQTKVTAKTESLNKAKEDERQAKEKLDECIQAFVTFVSQFKPVDSYAAAVDMLRGLKEVIEKINNAQAKINNQSEFLMEEMDGKSTEQTEQEASNMREQILSVNHGVLPEKLDDWNTHQLEQQSENSFTQLQEVREALIKLNSTIKNQFIGRKNVSEIEEEMLLLKKAIEEREEDFQCLSIAQSTLIEAFTEIRQSFGPLLNDKTAEIFNQITGGKYHNVIISRNFDINVQDAQSAVSHEWQYLSSGTIDQAYLALRLAVADLLAREKSGLPLMLDDVLLQYDDSRAEQGLRFLANFASEGTASTQIILFTCHKSILDWAEKDHLNVSIKSVF